MKMSLLLSISLLLLLLTFFHAGTPGSSFAGKSWIYIKFKSNTIETAVCRQLLQKGSFILVCQVSDYKTMLAIYSSYGRFNSHYSSESYTQIIGISPQDAAPQSNGKSVVVGGTAFLF